MLRLCFIMFQLIMIPLFRKLYDSLAFMQSSERSTALASNSEVQQLDMEESQDEEDLEDDFDYSILEDDLRLQQKVNSVATINSMRMGPVSKCRM